jgi:hypothetical protein
MTTDLGTVIRDHRKELDDKKIEFLVYQMLRGLKVKILISQNHMIWSLSDIVVQL